MAKITEQRIYAIFDETERDANGMTIPFARAIEAEVQATAQPVSYAGTVHDGRLTVYANGDAVWSCEWPSLEKLKRYRLDPGQNRIVEDPYGYYFDCDKVHAAFANSAIIDVDSSPKKIVAWLKHGPYEDGEQMVCVFEDPHDEDCYSALVYADPSLNSPVDSAEELVLRALNAAVARTILDNDRKGAVKWAKGLIMGQDLIVRTAPEHTATSDPMAGLHGIRHEDAQKIIDECAAQAGISDTSDFTAAGWNLLNRVADAAHKAGARERDAALAGPAATGRWVGPRWPGP